MPVESWRTFIISNLSIKTDNREEDDDEEEEDESDGEYSDDGQGSADEELDQNLTIGLTPQQEELLQIVSFSNFFLFDPKNIDLKVLWME